MLEPQTADSQPGHGSVADDKLLLARIADGDSAAFRSLFLHYHKRMSRFLMRFVRRHDLVEEIINDTMYVVWCKAGSFRGESQVSTWILGIAYRKALKVLKKCADLETQHAPLDADGASPADDAGAAQRELRECIDRGLAALPPVQRVVIELAYFMGYSCEEIAMITDTPTNTVKTRMFHARERLRHLLAELPPPNGVSP